MQKESRKINYYDMINASRELMRYTLKIIRLSLIIILFIVVVWMNATPGHFNTGNCGCELNYSQKDYSEIMICPQVECEDYPVMIGSLFLVPLSFIDINR